MSDFSKNADHPGTDNPAGGGFESVREKVDGAIKKDREDTDQARRRLSHGGNRTNHLR